METETHNSAGDSMSEPSRADHEPNVLDSSACPRCYPRQYAANHARHRANARSLFQSYVHAVGA